LNDREFNTILIIGSGPIVIGQACEFDYSGTQACKALREDGYRVVLVNSNPATIMTDPQVADRTYIEPITVEAVTLILEREAAGPHPVDALLPTIGGQTALNTACQLQDEGVLERFNVTMIGATREVIYRAEDREQFMETVASVGLRCPRSGVAGSVEEAVVVLDGTPGGESGVGLPAIIRPAFTLGGTGGGIAYNREEFEDLIRRGLDASMNRQVLIDQSLIGWKEYELELMRDGDDNVVVVCAIENFDPMGVHTGDSITVAPSQTLTDKEYQHMRDAAAAIMRAIGVDTGGSNIQFAVNPADGDLVVIEMNPRVSRSSALASKATGFPIAKIAAKLAIGHKLWDLRNDITGQTAACFEPTIDYVVTKIPRWTFEKFPEADETLTTQMKSVGEAMSIGRTFKESFQKGIRSMEVKRFGLGLDGQDAWLGSLRSMARQLSSEDPGRLARAVELISVSMGVCTPLMAVAALLGDDLQLAGVDADTREALEVLGRDLPAAADTADGTVPEWPVDAEKLQRKIGVPSQGRCYYIRYALHQGWSVQRIHEACGIDPWFIDQMQQLAAFEHRLIGFERLEDVPADVLAEAKQYGFSDAQLACLYLGRIDSTTILAVRNHRETLGIRPVYKLVDTCAAEFDAVTPYYYSTYESPTWQLAANGGEATVQCDDEIRVSDSPKIVILGGGPNRIGQGIEFDYCCVQAAFAAREMGFESVMINSNPETVSTDYDTSDLLFFEPLTLEDVLNVCERLNGQPFDADGGGSGGRLHGVIVQFGGQTPLNLAHGLRCAGVPIIGTDVDSIDLAEDRKRFSELCSRLDIRQPPNGIAYSVDEALVVAKRIGYPVLVRPSFVLGGRAMEIVYDDSALRRYVEIAQHASDLPDQPILVDRFLSDAIECDVDVVADFTAGHDATSSDGNGLERAIVCGVMEHIEEAGIHSGDSACAIPPHSLPEPVIVRIKDQAKCMAAALGVRGLMNIQFAIKRADDEPDGHAIYVLEVNPRASRTVPFVSKATGVSWARIAAKIMAGTSLDALGLTETVDIAHTCVKESVFPFTKFPGVDVILGPEMRSTGEVMGIDTAFPLAYAKSQMAAGTVLPTEGTVFLSVRDADKPGIVDVACRLIAMGFDIVSSAGTHQFLAEQGVKTTRLKKISEGRPNGIDLIKDRALSLIINTPTRTGSGSDEGRLRSTAVRFALPYITTATAAAVAVRSIEALKAGQWSVRSLQEFIPEAVAATS